MTRRPRVAVLYGGQSAEHAVSRRSAASVLAHLDRARFEVRPVEITTRGSWVVHDDEACPTAPAASAPADGPSHRLAQVLAALDGVDVVFPMLHGRNGEDGTVQGLLDVVGLPYVGCGVGSSAVGMDKAATKAVLRAHGLQVAEGTSLTADQGTPSPAERRRLGLPVFVKPARAGSSIGVSRVDRWADAPAAVLAARAVDATVLVEAAVPGREVDVGLLQHPDGRVEASPPLEIVLNDGEFFDLANKYERCAPPFRVPAALDADTTARLQEYARKVFAVLDCRGLLRVDFFVSPDREPVVNEVNTMPGMTVASQYPQMWAARGYDYPQVLDVLVATALARGRSR